MFEIKIMDGLLLLVMTESRVWLSDRGHVQVKIFTGECIREERSCGVEYMNIDNFGVKISEDNTEPGAEF